MTLLYDVYKKLTSDVSNLKKEYGKRYHANTKQQQQKTEGVILTKW